MSIGKVAIATATFACTALLSVSWSEQRGVSLLVESAQARIGRPLTPFSVAGVARRQYRRAAYGYGYGAGLVGAGVAAAAIGAAAATSPWGYYGGGYPGYYGAYYGGGYYGGYPGYYGAYYRGGYRVAGNYGAYAYGGYPYGYYPGTPWAGPTLFPRYYGGGW